MTSARVETPQDAARRLAGARKVEALHVYRDAYGEVIYWRIRAREAGGEKWMRPMRLNGHGYELREPDFPDGKPLYKLDRIAANPTAPVWIVEGEKSVGALSKLGAVASTSGGAQSAAAADWTPLQGRECRLWADNDDAGKAYMGDVAAILQKLGCKLSAVDVEALRLPAKGDAWDWAHAHPDATLADLNALSRVVARHDPRDSRILQSPQSGATGAVLSGQISAVIVRRLSDVEAKPIRWLWPGRIARGKVSMIAGHPGLGKSQVTAALAAVVTTGGKWPVDRTACERGSVILLNAEDDVADTIRPRLEAAGADVTRIEIIDAVSTGFYADGRESRRGFNLKVDLGALDALLSKRGEVVLVTIDPVSAYLSGVDTHVNADVRAILAPLGELAARHGVAIVCVSHLNKGGANKAGVGDALLRVSGSLAFVAAARAAYIVASDQENPSRRLFLPAKNNVGKDQAGLAFSVESHQLPGGIETSRVLWEPDPVAMTVDEAMAAPATDDDRTMTDEAVDLLREMLLPGRVLAKDLKRQATDAGISDKALRTARHRLAIVVEREGFGPQTKTSWRLPSAPLVPSTPISAPSGNRAQMYPEGTNGGSSDPASLDLERF
jgi:putative DNA primase/helicase